MNCVKLFSQFYMQNLAQEFIKDQQYLHDYHKSIEIKMNPEPANQIKVDKYDRQIRLWGPRGQRSLGTAKVALVKCTGAGIQALKNLILPGVGTVDIWDQSKIKVEDLSSSFFYEQDSVGQSKAEVASKNLLEMNEDSHGSFFLKTVDEFLADETAVKSYNFVIFGGEMTEDQTKRASEILWKLQIPCAFIIVIGFFFYVRLQKKTHFVQSSNTMAKKFYLRINDPFPALLQHAKENCVYTHLQKLKDKNLDEFRDLYREFSHIPAVLVLISVLDRLPAEKRKRNIINQQLKEIYEKAHPDYRENIREAMSGRIDSLQTPDVFMIDIGLLTNKNVVECKKNSHIMLKFLQATEHYFQETGKLPQPTSLPDLNTTTQKYINLKQIYKQKHEADIKIICEKIRTKFGDQKVDQGLISDYINHLYNLEVVEMRPYYEELGKPDASALMNYWEHEKDLLIAIRAYQHFYGHNEQFPYEKLKQKAETLAKEYGIESFDEKYLQQAYRSKGFSTINIYSIAGALAGQQTIKLITSCFCPMNSGFIFDGANGKGYQVKL